MWSEGCACDDAVGEVRILYRFFDCAGSALDTSRGELFQGKEDPIGIRLTSVDRNLPRSSRHIACALVYSQYRSNTLYTIATAVWRGGATVDNECQTYAADKQDSLFCSGCGVCAVVGA